MERCEALAAVVRGAEEELAAGGDNPALLEALWQGEGLGVLLWALSLASMPPYDRPFNYERLLALDPRRGEFRHVDEIDAGREAARLWHWRARTTAIRELHETELPARWHSFDQLVAAAAMRGHERGLLPRPLRGDFPAFGTVYRDLSREQRSEADSIAWERHRALNWLCGLGTSWDDVPTDT